MPQPTTSPPTSAADAEGDAGAGGEDEDDVVVQAARGDADLAGRVKCPITKRLMTDPVHGCVPAAAAAWWAARARE